MQSLTRRLRGRPGAPVAVGFGLLTVCACDANRSAAIPAHRASTVSVKFADHYAGPFYQVTSGVDGLVTANQVFEP
ncbi:MAG TPA: hypothetical protein VGA04_13345 [Streptosporangiaceae bacterium]